MHELSIASDILDVVERTIGGRKPLQSVRLVLGSLSGVSADSLQFCFTELAEQEGFGRPELEIAAMPAGVRCRDCGDEHTANDLAKGCPVCQSLNREILSGYECMVDTVTFEEE
jgi:hydrogenase nickel insertion protein HypA